MGSQAYFGNGTKLTVLVCSSTYPAYFGDGTKLTVLDSTIKESDPKVKVYGPSENESCKEKVTLVCVAEDFYPDHVKVTWKVGRKERIEGVATDQNATQNENKKYSITSRLKVKKSEWYNDMNSFTCTVNYYGKDKTYTDFTDSIKGTSGGGGGFNREMHMKSSVAVQLGYGMFIAKSALYGLIIFVIVWKQGSAGKRAH